MSYVVKVTQNVLGDNVYSIQSPGSSDYYTQPILDFSAGEIYTFDISD